MNVHLVQFDIAWENPPENRLRADRLIASAGVDAGDLILLPEMFDTGFSFAVDRTADSTGASRAFISEIARRYRAMVIGGVTVIETDGSARNRAVIADADRGITAQYDKSRMFPLGSPSEADRLTPGNRTVVVDWRAPASSLALAPMICYDLRFPELFLAALRAGAGGFAVIANWPAVRAAHWRALLIARAIENQAYVFAVNRIGSDPGLRYAGGSMIIDPLGQPVAEGDDSERVVSAEVKRENLEDWRGRFPAWRTRIGV